MAQGWFRLGVAWGFLRVCFEIAQRFAEGWLRMCYGQM